MTSRPRTVSVIGLGYVGLPVAVEFARKFPTIGFDLNSRRVTELGTGLDRNGEIPSEDLRQPNLRLTDKAQDLRGADFHIVAVPTPIDDAKQPDLKPLLLASKLIGEHVKKGDIIVFESTVYPGATEEECVPVIEKASGLRGGVDFKVGYSPERINPGDKAHTFTTIKKVVSGQDAESLEVIAEMYGSVVKAGLHLAPSIKVAEAAKVIENTQRDLNIALMNELALIFDQMGIDTHDVLNAAATKWNFLKFTPGLVGGHCIGVDPYYLTHKAEKMNYLPQVILAGRRINDGMGKFIAQKTIKEMIRAGQSVRGSTVTVLGLTFKENCRDLRNTRVVDIVRELEEYGVQPQICDPLAYPAEAEHEYGLRLVPFEELRPADALILAVAHDQFRALTPAQLRRLMKDSPLLVDVKGTFSKDAMAAEKIRFWRL